MPISFVPEKIQEIKDKYTDTLEHLLPFINAEINDENIEKFDVEINRIIHRHRYVIEKLGIGIAEFRDNLNLKDPKGLGYFEAISKLTIPTGELIKKRSHRPKKRSTTSWIDF